MSDIIPISRHKRYRPATAEVPASLRTAADVLGFELPTVDIPPGFTFRYRRSEAR